MTFVIIFLLGFAIGQSIEEHVWKTDRVEHPYCVEDTARVEGTLVIYKKCYNLKETEEIIKKSDH